MKISCMRISWRPMRPADIDAVMEIAAIVHPAYPEARAVFVDRLAVYPAGCFALTVGEHIKGYVLSHPWVLGSAPALDCLIERLPDRPNCFYVHDIAILPHMQGKGAARHILPSLVAAARTGGFKTISLCAVNGSGPFWQKQGFEPIAALDAASGVAGYGAGAVLMRMDLEA